MPKGKVLEFTQERGFGKLQLEDGTVMNFDASVIDKFDIKPGDVGDVTLKEIRGRTVVRRVDFTEDDE